MLGRIDYRDAWRIQHELVTARAADESPDQLLLLEPPAVLTLGPSPEASADGAEHDEAADDTDGDGLPTAIQIVGRPFGEATLLSLAAQIEKVRPWAHRRPPVC